MHWSHEKFSLSRSRIRRAMNKIAYCICIIHIKLQLNMHILLYGFFSSFPASLFIIAGLSKFCPLSLKLSEYATILFPLNSPRLPPKDVPV